MTDIVYRLGGTLNQLIGFFLLASWGAPVSWPNSADRACRAALEMVAAVERLNEDLAAEAYPPLRLRIGINTGNALVGNMGTERRFSYNVLGDSVNLAATLSGLCQQYMANILITQFTFEELKDHFNLQSLGEVKVKGKANPVTIYSLVPDREKDNSLEVGGGGPGGTA